LKVFFTQTEHEDQIWGSDGCDWALRMREQIERAATTQYAVVDDPVKADIIVFWEPHQDSQVIFTPRLRAHPLVGRFPNKVYTVSVEDNPLGFLSGLYASLPRHRHDPRRHRTWVYYRTENPHVHASREERRPKNLAAFMGSGDADVRRALFELQGPFAQLGIVVQRTPRNRFAPNPADPALKEAQMAYIDAILDAKFSLCPRSNGAGTYRLQESMALGRAPVILSDAWVPVSGVDWNEIAIIVEEDDVGCLPSILHEHEPRWEAMGRKAREVYDAMFCRETFARNALDQIVAIHRHRRHDERDFFARWPEMIAAEPKRSASPAPTTTAPAAAPDPPPAALGRRRPGSGRE